MQSQDFKWFLKNYDNLFQQYGICYLSIKNKKVLGAYSTYGEGVRNTKEKLGTFIVQLCNGRKDGYTNTITSMNFICR